MTDESLEQRPEGWHRAARAYDEVIRRFTERYATDAVELAQVEPGMKVLDVAAGSGAVTLEAAQRGAEVLATDFAEGMLEVLRERLVKFPGVRAEVMDGQRLDVEDGAFDRAFSMFGLMFFPDLDAGFRELHRALKLGGRAVVGVWQREGNDIRDVIGGALVRALPDFDPNDFPPPTWARLSHPDGLRDAMLEAGFASATVFRVRHLWTLESPEWLWERLPHVGPGFEVLFRMLPADRVGAVGEAFRDEMRARYGDGPFAIGSDAILGLGRKA